MNMRLIRSTIIVSAIIVAAAMPLAAGATGSPVSVKAENDRLCANWLAYSQWSGSYDASGQRVCTCVSGYTMAEGPRCLKVQSNISIVNGHRVQTFADGSRLDLDTNQILSNGGYKPPQPAPQLYPTVKNTVSLSLAVLGGEPCVHPEHAVCIPPGFRVNVWQCEDAYFEYNGQCYPKAFTRPPWRLNWRSGDDKFQGCQNNHGAGAVWDIGEKRCVCSENFAVSPDGTTCESDRWCQRKMGVNSYFNSNLIKDNNMNPCVCQPGHALVGGICN